MDASEVVPATPGAFVGPMFAPFGPLYDEWPTRPGMHVERTTGKKQTNHETVQQGSKRTTAQKGPKGAQGEARNSAECLDSVGPALGDVRLFPEVQQVKKICPGQFAEQVSSMFPWRGESTASYDVDHVRRFFEGPFFDSSDTDNAR